MLIVSQKKIERVVDKGYSLFVTGEGGSGKSFFLRHTIEKLRRNGDHCFVTAPTGKAAANTGGSTIHSFAGIGTGSKSAHELIAIIKSNQEALLRWEQCKVLIIDEVSMLSRELFEKLEMIARCLKKNSKLFGGIQLILSGDFFQLRPVIQNNAGDRENDEDVYCFAGPMWSCCVEITVFLNVNHRQHEPELIQLLNEFRMGELSECSQKFIEESLTRPLDCNTLDVVQLYSQRDSVTEANDKCLNALPGEPHHYISNDSGDTKALINCSAQKNLVVKLKARMVLLKNLRLELVNGLCGTIHSFVDDFPLVIFDNGQRELIREKLFTVERDGNVVATRKQIPLDLAYAMTIHKSQGMSFPLLDVDLSSVFEAGQAYVPVSRAMTIDGLKISSYRQKMPQVCQLVVNFYANCVVMASNLNVDEVFQSEKKEM